MSLILAMKWSAVGFAVALVLGLLSMGLLGAALYYACYPVLAPFYGNPNSDWSGDWVWSAMIWAGMLWSISFLVAGWLNLQLVPHLPRLPRAIAYLAVLWLGALAVWYAVLAASYEPAKAHAFYSSPCHDQSYIDMTVKGAPLPLTPADVTRTSCADPGVHADRIAGAMLGPVDTSKVIFVAIDGIEAPVRSLVDMFPEAFTTEQLNRSTIVSNWKAGHNMAAHIIRSPDGMLFLLGHDIL
ncbi:hypothetical protein [Brucella pseudogrignonensis]|uniref:hypothetical protein n=1 Tax=Brucella pseudogrignonensis TaxID=419475 RepID=UPI0012ED5450|nr:hypothetical protein [Brucella pseudogrignonensis]